MITQITKADYTDRKGVALITVLGTLLFVSMIGIAILQLAISHSGLSFHQITRQRAYYASQAGLEYAMWSQRNGIDPTNSYCFNPSNGTITTMAGSCGSSLIRVDITRTGASPPYTLSANAAY